MGKNSDWKKEFKRVKNNPIYFIDKYYNLVHKDNLIELSDEEKQEQFDRHKGIPLIKDIEQFTKFNDKVSELKEKGYKDWEIF